VAAACAGDECRAVGPVDCSDGNPCTDDRCDSERGCLHPPLEGVAGLGCCLQTMPLECSRRKIARKLAKQWKQATRALEAVRTPGAGPGRQKRQQKKLDRALKVLRALRNDCPDGIAVPACLRAGETAQ
jgi:hypothetical protein